MAVEPGDAKFVSRLDEAGKKKAKDELHELNEKDRASAVQALRKWVLEQNWLKSPTDFDFLLRFIRVRKYSQLGARETLENYWTNRTKIPEWFKNVDPADEKLLKVLRTGMMFCPKRRDKQGRTVIFSTMAFDENSQVNGVVCVSDYTGITMELIKYWNPESEKKMISYFQKSLPIRFKAFHMYKEPAFLDAIMSVITPFMSKKFKDRMYMHGRSLVKLYEELGMEVFPDEYLPDDYEGPSAGPVKDIIEQTVQAVMQPEFRNHILEISSGKYSVDLEKRKQAEKTPEASFRKLNVD